MAESPEHPLDRLHSTGWFGHALDASPMPAFIKDAEGRFAAVNSACLGLLGVDSDVALIGKRDAELDLPDTQPLTAGWHEAELSAMRGFIPQFDVQARDTRSGRTFAVDRIPFHTNQGETALLVHLRPVDRRRDSHSHTDGQRDPDPVSICQHELLAQISASGVFDLREGHAPALSPRLLELFELRRDGEQDRLPALLRSLTSSNRRELRGSIRALTPGNPLLVMDVQTGSERIIEVRALAMFNAEGTLQRLIGTADDVTSLRRSSTEHRTEATTDYLTGLANRRAAQAHIERFIAIADRRPFALGFIDLDRFKEINDNFGHAAGDHLLKVIAERLLTAAGPDDVVARLGGDEFMVLFTAASEAELLPYLKNMQRAVQTPILLDDTNRMTPSVSVGATWVNTSSTSEGDILREADTAMYASKEKRIGEIIIFENEMLEARRRYQHTVQALRRGIQQREFELWYQPIINVHNENWLGIEALMRWNSPELGCVAADDFVEMLEANGLITDMTQTLLDRLTGDIEVWNRLNCLPDSVAFNLSPQQLASEALSEQCGSFLERIDDLPVQLVFEVTESAVIENLDDAQSRLRELRAMGCRIALDDFGVGYSSLAVLHQLPIEILKLDGTFTESLFSSERAQKIVRSILDLANTLSVPAVAERVESAEQAEWLGAAGCTYLQGYLFCAPMSSVDVRRYLQSHTARTALARAS